MSVLKCDDCGEVQELRADVCRAVCLKCKGLMNPLITQAESVAEVPCSAGLSCPVCGGKMAYIRGRNPGDDEREVCPTCLQERMEEVNSISSRDYNVAYTGGAG